MRLDYFMNLPDDDDFVGYTKRFVAEFARRAELPLNAIGVQLIEINHTPRVWAVNYSIGALAQMVFNSQCTVNDMYKMHNTCDGIRAMGVHLFAEAEPTEEEMILSMRCWSLKRIYETLLDERGFFLVESETSIGACLPYDPPIAVNLVSTLPEITYNCSRT